MGMMDFSVDLDDLGRYAASEGGFSAHKGYGSGGFLMKQGRFFESIEDDAESLQMGSKMLKKDDILGPKPMVFQTKHNLLGPNSFLSDGQLGSSPLTKPEGLISTHDTFQGTALSPFQPSPYTKVSGARGPFTPSQWLELEHQALIFKYMTTGVPVPHNLLLPLRKTLNPAVFAFPAASLRTNPLGWGSFHIGISGSLDPEPGRCRRTDGKKWRCARDAAPDQKYCERHLNRGRHRSRKPVEGQNGQGITATGATSASKAVPAAAPLQATPVCSSVPNSPSTAQHQIKTFLSPADPSSAANYRHGFCINKSNLEDPMRNLQNGSLLSSINLKVGDSISAQKQQFPYHELARKGLDFVSDSCPQRNSYLDSKNFGFSSDLTTKEPQQPHSLHHFIDQWPKTDNLQPERAQLSISVPVSYAKFSTSLAPLTHEKPTFSQLKLTPEIGSTTSMCVGMEAVDGSVQISWKTSLGGPLAEMLNSTSTTAMTASSSEHPNSSFQLHDTSLGCEFPTQNLSDRHFVDNNIWINVQQQCRDLPESRNKQNQRK